MNLEMRVYLRKLFNILRFAGMQFNGAAHTSTHSMLSITHTKITKHTTLTSVNLDRHSLGCTAKHFPGMARQRLLLGSLKTSQKENPVQINDCTNVQLAKPMSLIGVTNRSRGELNAVVAL